MGRVVPVVDRLAALTDSSAGPEACWTWLGGSGKKSGSAAILVDGRNVTVRRLLWQNYHGPLKETDMVFTSCGDRKCVNPAHLRKESLLLEDKFWSLVKKTEGDGCWEWQGYYFESGYGGIKINQRQRQAHRVAWELVNGPIEGHIPGDKDHEICVCHRCDNIRCVRPDHLFLGKDQDNHDDMVRKGRHAHGPKLSEAMRAAHAKALAEGRAWRSGYRGRLTEEQREAIRMMRAQGKVYRVIAEEFGMSESRIWTICHPRSVPTSSSAPEDKR